MLKFTYFLSLILIIVLSNNAFAQKNKSDIFESIRSKNSYQGEINIYQKTYVDSLIKRNIRINKKKDGIDGYRILIYKDLGNNAESDAKKIQSLFLSKYPNIDTYLDYNKANFRVLVGDYSNKSAALKCLSKIAKDFPTGYIIPTTINFYDL